MRHNELYHHGIKGQKWGIRRFQNKDGSRTLLGKKKRAEHEPQKIPKPSRLTLMLAHRALKQSAKLNGMTDIDDISLDKNMSVTVKYKDGRAAVGKPTSSMRTGAIAAHQSFINLSIKQHNDMTWQAAAISSASAVHAMNSAMAAANHAQNASIMAIHHF